MSKLKRPQNTVYPAVIEIKGRENNLNGLIYENERGLVAIAEDYEKNEIVLGLEVERKTDKTKKESFTFSKKAAVALALMIISEMKQEDFEKFEREIIKESIELGA